jgi:4'-phosphopantetheinyl transferase
MINDLLFLQIQELPDLQKDHVQILVVPLDKVSPGELLFLLNPAEKKRAAEFKFAWLQHRFVVARGVLRSLLAKYLHKSSHDIEFVNNDYGKPSVIITSDEIPIKFNISHTDNLGVFSFALEHELGVDVEFMRDNAEYEKIATRFFADAEVEKLLALPQAERKQAFFNCWVYKEAYIKALGMGLSKPLNSFVVDFAGKVLPQYEMQSINGRQLFAINVGSDYAAALAVATEKAIKITTTHFLGKNID